MSRTAGTKPSYDLFRCFVLGSFLNYCIFMV